jgi:N6-L-threonylcarbamoyladenine synthase
MKPVRILGIETSCDETSVAILEVGRAKSAGKGSKSPVEEVRIVHHETATQIPIHQRYGGVVPEVAARTHVAEILSLLDRAKLFPAPKIDAIAVTRGPGLATALRVGIESARTLAYATGIPTIGVNHLEGHLASAWLVEENRTHWKFPILALLVSGGHTELVLMKDFCSYRVIGRTRDDAAGEAFDKTAKLMGLGYPGGPVIAERATSGRVDAFELPRPMLHDPSFDFSFSGLKTAVRNVWESLSPKKRNDPKVVSDLCASVQEAIVDVLVVKTVALAKKYKVNAVCVVGGVSANRHLQLKMSHAFSRELPSIRVLEPARGLHTDNAAMIAAAGAWRLQRKKLDDWKKLDAKPELDI